MAIGETSAPQSGLPNIDRLIDDTYKGDLSGDLDPKKIFADGYDFTYEPNDK